MRFFAQHVLQPFRRPPAFLKGPPAPAAPEAWEPAPDRLPANDDEEASDIRSYDRERFLTGQPFDAFAARERRRVRGRTRRRMRTAVYQAARSRRASSGSGSDANAGGGSANGGRVLSPEETSQLGLNDAGLPEAERSRRLWRNWGVTRFIRGLRPPSSRSVAVQSPMPTSDASVPRDLPSSFLNALRGRVIRFTNWSGNIAEVERAVGRDLDGDKGIGNYE